MWGSKPPVVIENQAYIATLWDAEINCDVPVRVNGAERPRLFVCLGGKSSDKIRILIRLPLDVVLIHDAQKPEFIEIIDDTHRDVVISDIGLGDSVHLIAQIPHGLRTLAISIQSNACSEPHHCNVQFLVLPAQPQYHHLHFKSASCVVTEMCAKKYGGHPVRTTTIPTYSSIERVRQLERAIPRGMMA